MRKYIISAVVKSIVASIFLYVSYKFEIKNGGPDTVSIFLACCAAIVLMREEPALEISKKKEEKLTSEFLTEHEWDF